MNQYQRMVSYLYQYQQGEKGDNVGYVRVERKQQQCHIVIKMRPAVLEHMPEIRLFVQEPDGIVYVPAGNLKNGNNSLEAKFTTPADNIFQSGKSIDTMEGLLLYVSPKNYFATSWKNDRIFLGEMRTFQENGNSGSTAADGTSATPSQIVSSPAHAPTIEKTIQTAKKADEASRNTAPIPGNAADKNKSDISAIKTETQTAASGLTGSSSPADDNSLFKVTYPSKSKEQEHTVAQKSTPIPEQDKTSDLSAAQSNFQSAGSEAAASSERSAATSMLEMQSVCGVCPFKRKNLDYGKRMLCTFPEMHPFPDGKIKNCVRIEPQDIGCLPIRLWPLANNSFLLQGYFNYRHLIFVEFVEGGYALGVPGICTQREREAARRFSFPRFIPLSNEGNCNGAFGYWLQPLPRVLQ